MVRPLPNEFCPMQNKDFWWSVYGVSAFGYCHLAGPVCRTHLPGAGAIHASEKIDLCSSLNGFDLPNITVLLGFWYISNY